MTPIDTADRTIRNQRYRVWPVWLAFSTWSAFWMVASTVSDYLMSPNERLPVQGIVAIVMLLSFAVLLALLNRLPPRRLKLGEDLLVVPSLRTEVMHIRHFQFDGDPYEDYAESDLPIRVCQLTIERLEGKSIRLIVSLGDAQSAQEWAEQKGIAVIDPVGYSTGYPSKVYR